MYPQGYFPFPDGVLEPIPKEFLTVDVLGLAKSIAADGGFDRLNMLADALMEAGYENEYILLHLQQERRPQMCACSGGNRRADTNCTECECGSIPDRTAPLHKIGKELDCGCWQGTCWVVQWLLGEEQKVLARVTPLPDDADQRVIELPVVNPAAYFGRCWLVSYTDGFNEDSYLVEAAWAESAIDSWVESEFGKICHIAPEDLKDYEIPARSGHSEGHYQHSCSFTDDGTAYDSDNISVDAAYLRDRDYGHGRRARIVRYYGPSLPHEGVSPASYYNFGPCRVCGKDCHSVSADLCVCSQACAREAGDEGTSPSDAYPETPTSESGSMLEATSEFFGMYTGPDVESGNPIG